MFRLQKIEEKNQKNYRNMNSKPGFKIIRKSSKNYTSKSKLRKYTFRLQIKLFSKVKFHCPELKRMDT